MNPAGWGAYLVALPIIIDAPGDYRTRCGELVTITRPSTTNYFACKGFHHKPEIIPEMWHRSGRLLFGRETPHDIVRKD